MLKGIIQKIPSKNFPCRNYFMYDWDEHKEEWIIKQEFIIKKIKQDRLKKLKRICELI
ncbi:hypothetical protein M0Q97_08930 [Candidatus Dojkabacteria bacterium]|jgi:hypothetical protein|nr:hypothetical protein [Candidatus Dojkabacteria bacterium]